MVLAVVLRLLGVAEDEAEVDDASLKEVGEEGRGRLEEDEDEAGGDSAAMVICRLALCVALGRICCSSVLTLDVADRGIVPKSHKVDYAVSSGANGHPSHRRPPRSAPLIRQP